MILIFILFSTASFAQLNEPTTTAKISGYEMWYSYVMDSTKLGLRKLDGSLQKRSNGTYLHWLDDNGLIERRTYRKIILSFLRTNKYTVME